MQDVKKTVTGSGLLLLSEVAISLFFSIALFLFGGSVTQDAYMFIQIILPAAFQFVILWFYLSLNEDMFRRIMTVPDVKKMAVVIFLWVGCECLFAGLNLFVGLYSVNMLNHANQINYAAVWPFGYIAGVVFFALVPAFLEETLYRGILYPAFKKLAVPAGCIISSLFFGLYHGSVIMLAYGMIFGLILCLIVEFTDSIWYGVVLHAMYNLSSFTAMYYSAFTAKYYSTFHVMYHPGEDPVRMAVRLTIIGLFVTAASLFYLYDHCAAHEVLTQKPEFKLWWFWPYGIVLLIEIFFLT